MPMEVAGSVIVAEFPQLGLLLWDRRHSGVLSRREAFDAYEAKWRHVCEDTLNEGERALIRSLADEFGRGVIHG